MASLTDVTLNSILRNDKKDRPGFILPIATADDLVSKAESEGFKSILRMVPDNKQQAIKIKSFIAKITKTQRVAILVDEDNPTYSNNLSSNIAAQVRQNGGLIVLQKRYGNDNRLIDQIDLLTDHKILPEMIVFVGVSSNGLLLIDEMIALNLDIPILFTDGCTVDELMTKALKLKGPKYFLSAVELKENVTKPTYKPIGQDTFELAKAILSRIGGEVTRQTVASYIETHKKDIIIQGGAAGNYGFNDDGNNALMEFKIYTYNGGALSLVKGY